METFTVNYMLINSTDLNKILCNLGVRNISDCANEQDSPTPSKDINQAVRIVLYSLIFFLSVVGNSLIITVLVKTKHMKTITNMFLLSLAISDLLVSLVCIPFTLIPNLMKNFVFGLGLCKLVTYFMGISVSVSTFNLVAISLERYSAICHPLTSKAWQTKSHAIRVITATWLVSFILMLPYPIYSTLKPFVRHDNSSGHMCRLIWPHDIIQQAWYVSLLLILFLIPGFVMLTAYGLISLELYKGIKHQQANRRPESERLTSTGSLESAESDGCYIKPSKKNSLALRKGSTSEAPTVMRVVNSSSNARANLVAKKRVIRMLLVIVFLFFLCWTPVFVVNAWKAFDQRSNRLTGAPISFIHLLSYTSACVNPIIYCFMNKKFRQHLLAILPCLRRWGRVRNLSFRTSSTLSKVEMPKSKEKPKLFKQNGHPPPSGTTRCTVTGVDGVASDEPT